MRDKSTHFVIGLGQIGEPIRALLGCGGWDVQQAPLAEFPRVDCLHICFPYSEAFLPEVTRYTKAVWPLYVVIHSTVQPGTTVALQGEIVYRHVVYSPVRGRHGQLEHDLLHYTKYVASPRPKAAGVVAGKLAMAGFSVRVHPDPTALELSKVFQTTATAVQVAFAQEMARYCEELEAEFMDAQVLMDMPNLPHVIHQPGFIGGHCLTPNLDFLQQIRESDMVKWIARSNSLREANHGREKERLYPIPLRPSV
jgi:UDP-glucose 6-dehydrogenase